MIAASRTFNQAMALAYTESNNHSAAPRLTRAGQSRGLLWLTGCAVALLVTLAVGALLVVSREMSAARESHVQVQRARELIEQLQVVFSTLQDAETGERGFLVTGNPKFLEPYHAARDSIEQQLTRLEAQITDPGSQPLREDLARKAREQVQFFQHVIDLRATPEGVAAALNLVTSEVGKQRMDAIRTIVQTLRTREQAQLSNRLAAFHARSERTEFIVRLSLISATLLVCIAGALLFRHIKSRLVAEQAANDAFALLRASMDNLAQGVAVFDAGRRLIAWNTRYLELCSLDPQRIHTSMTAEEIVEAMSGPADTDRDGRSTYLTGVTSRLPFDVESGKPDVSVQRVQGRPMQNGNYIVTHADVTDLKQSELAYREQATRLSLILDNVVDAIITINESGSIESWSNGAERLFGYKSEEVLRRNVRILMPEPHSSAHDSYMRRYRQTGERHIIGTRREVEALHKDGRRIHVDLGISEIRIGNRRTFIGIVRDISARREVERLKSGFVSTVSHELRTPLTSISGSLGLLAGGVAGELPLKATRLIDIARLNAERLVRLINDILDLEKAESGRLDFRLELLRLKPIVTHAIDANRAYAQGYGAALELDPRSDDVSALVDRDRLIQVLTNLISNAAKFSPRGGTVTLAIRAAHDTVRISVRDEGPGIPGDFHKRIFEKFAQADSSDSRAKGGTGLGLSIAKTIVERLGGNIGFDSPPGKGATFFINLPVRHQPAPQQFTGTGLFSGPAVLVCEDDPDVATLLAEILRKEGMRAETVSSARAARAALEAVRFDIAIVDLHLPDAEGLEFISELRSRQGTKAMPIIVVTASARVTGDLHGVSALRLADWLQKPIDPQRLLEAIGNVLAQPRQGRPRILHVEDDLSLTQLVGELLSGEADIIAASSVAQATQRVNENPDYDLVILDITLGDGCGLDLLPLLNSEGRRPPVILYSATEASSEISSMVQGALVKSRDPIEQLLASVRGLVKRSA